MSLSTKNSISRSIMGGGSKKGGGGGGGAAGGTFNIPTGLTQGAASETGLGQYATALTNPLAAMTSWASSLATGQSVNVPTAQAYATQAGPDTIWHGGGKPWQSSFNPQTGLVTYTNPTDPAQTFQASLSEVQSSTDTPSAVIQQWQQAADAYQQSKSGGGQGGQVLGGTYGDQLLPGVTQDQVNSWYQQHYGKAPQSDSIANYAFNQSWSKATGQQVGSAGPLLSQAYQDIQQQQAATGQMAGIEAQTQKTIGEAEADVTKYAGQGDVEYQQAQKFFSTADAQEAQAQKLYGVGYNELSDADKRIVDANALVTMTTTGQGLFPAQQAMIEQARSSEEEQLASTLGAAGLGQSTQLAQMKGAADQAAAATAGQLQQGNIQAAEQVLSGAVAQQAGAQKTLGLAQTGMATAAETAKLGIAEQQTAQASYQLEQAAQKISMAGQELLSGEQAQLVSELSNITKETTAFQQQMWGQAMQGYGLMGQIIQTGAQSYGYSLNAYQSVLQAMEQQNQINAGIQQAAMQADQQGTSNLLGGLGMLFGQGGSGGGGGLLGSLGGLLGAGAGAAGGAAAAAGAGGIASGAAGVGIDAAITAVGAAI